MPPSPSTGLNFGPPKSPVFYSPPMTQAASPQARRRPAASGQADTPTHAADQPATDHYTYRAPSRAETRTLVEHVRTSDAILKARIGRPVMWATGLGATLGAAFAAVAGLVLAHGSIALIGTALASAAFWPLGVAVAVLAIAIGVGLAVQAYRVRKLNAQPDAQAVRGNLLAAKQQLETGAVERDRDFTWRHAVLKRDIDGALRNYRMSNRGTALGITSGLLLAPLLSAGAALTGTYDLLTQNTGLNGRYFSARKLLGSGPTSALARTELQVLPPHLFSA